MAPQRSVPAEADVVVIGAGIAGLTAARRLHRSGHRVLVLERDERVGGRLRTVEVDGRAHDVGAQFISGFYRATRELLASVDLTDRLVRRPQRALVVRDGQQGLWPLSTLLGGHALSAPAKLRLTRIIGDLVGNNARLDIHDLGKARELDTESTDGYIRRTVGTEALEYFFAPLSRGLLYWDTDSTSAPVMLAILKAFATNRGTYRVEGGFAQLPEALSAQVPVFRRQPVRRILRDGDDFHVDTMDGTRVRTRAVVCATTAETARIIAPRLPDGVAALLAATGYSRTAMATFRVPRSIRDCPDGAVLFPIGVSPDISSVNPRHDGEPETASARDRLINVYLSTTGFDRHRDLDDAALGTAVIRKLRFLLGRRDWLSAARLVGVERWPAALPRFAVGHLHRLRAFQAAQPRLGGLTFAGDYTAAPYIDGAVSSGVTAADHVQRWLATRPARNPV